MYYVQALSQSEAAKDAALRDLKKCQSELSRAKDALGDLQKMNEGDLADARKLGEEQLIMKLDTAKICLRKQLEKEFTFKEQQLMQNVGIKTGSRRHSVHQIH